MSVVALQDFIGPISVSAFSMELGESVQIVSMTFSDEGGNRATLQILQRHIPALHAAITEALTPHLNAEMLAKLEAEEQTTWPDLPVPNVGTDPKEKPE